MITRIIDRNVKLPRLLCLPEGAPCSKTFLLVAVLAILGAFTGCADAHLPLLTSIAVSPANSTIDIGQTQQFTAQGTFSDGSSKDLTNLVTWSSSNTTVASISASGLALGQAQGSSMISARFNTVDGPVTGGAAVSVIVTLKSLTITPVNPSIANGTSLQLTATGIFSDRSTQNLTASASWTSSSTSVASVSSSGLVTATGVGTTTVTATQAGVSATTTVTVTPATLTSITVTPPDSSIANGTSLQLIATGNFSDGTTQNLTAFVTWASSDPSLATVGNTAGSQGLVTGTAVGSVSITATQGGVSGSTAVTVTPATLTSITITPPDSSIATGTTEHLIATGNFSDGTTQNLTAFVTWVSAARSLATVSNAAGSQGLVTGTGVGNTTVTATFGGVSGSTGVTVTPPTLVSIAIEPPSPSLAKGTSLTLTAMGTFSDGTAQVLTTSATWTSSANGVAIVSNAAGSQGLVTGSGIGNATITATQAGVSGSATVTVTAAILTSIAVTPAENSIAKGLTAPLTAIGNFSDGTMQDFTDTASWISSSDAIAPVENLPNTPGLVTGVAVGSATITATQAGISGSASVAVTPAILISIAVNPQGPTIGINHIQQVTATGTFSDGTTQNVTSSASWTSSSDASAPVENLPNTPGLVTGVAMGSATITATQNGLQGSTTVTVVPPPEFAYVTNDSDNTVVVFQVNLGTGVLTQMGSPIPNPGRGAASVTATLDGRFLYTANQGDGTVTAYAINTPASGLTPIGGLTLIGNIPSGAGAFGIGVDPSGKFVYVGNVAGNSVSGYAIDPNTGALTPVPNSPFAGPTGGGSQGVAALPLSKLIYVTDSGNNQVSGYSLDSTTGSLNLPGATFGPTGRDPVSITVDPSGKFAYTADNLSPNTTYPFGSVTAFAVTQSDPNFGHLTPIATYAVGTMNGGPAMVAVDPKSEFAYVAGGGVVTAFTINSAASGLIPIGGLTPVAGSPFAAGLNTLWVAVDPSGKFVYVTNHGSFGSGTVPGGVSAYAINPANGALTEISGSPFPLDRGPSSITVVALP